MAEQRHDTLDARINLQRLPVFEPSAALWPRVLAGQRRRQRMRMWRRAGAGVAATIALGVAVVLSIPHPAPNLQQELAAGQRESHALEEQWLQISPAQPTDAANLVRVHMIDAELQAAYDRDEGAQAVASLWRQRNDALRGLIAQVRDARAGGAAVLTNI